MKLESNTKTVCAPLTRRGRGAVAVIGIKGPISESTLNKSFQPVGPRGFLSLRSRTVIYGSWLASGEDLVVYRRGPESFEVHCHGGTIAAASIIESLSAEGVIEVSPQCFVDESCSAWDAGTQIALTEATTERTAVILLGQLQQLPNSIARIESLIEKGEKKQAIDELESMLAWSRFGLHLTTPRSIVLCGPPNVGKSSLVNAIVGFQRAIVHHVAGTTRDVVSQSTAIAGWPVELKDTAGLRQAQNEIELKGIGKANSQIETADLKICVFDASRDWTQTEQAMLDSINPHLVVLNKSDLAPGEKYSARPKAMETSATTGLGVAALIDRIGNLLVPELPGRGVTYPVTVEQKEILVEWVSRLKSID